jgi:glutaminyl-peptide cyclotransferase
MPLLIPRYPTSPGLKSVRQFIKTYFASLNWHAQIDSFTDQGTPIGSVDFENLIFTHNPNAPKKIVLAAHYESKYKSDDSRGDLQPDGFIGATDSAWSCALLMYLASVIAETVPVNDQYSFQIVFFDGEEAIR